MLVVGLMDGNRNIRQPDLHWNTMKHQDSGSWLLDLLELLLPFFQSLAPRPRQLPTEGMTWQDTGNLGESMKSKSAPSHDHHDPLSLPCFCSECETFDVLQTLFNPQWQCWPCHGLVFTSSSWFPFPHLFVIFLCSYTWDYPCSVFFDEKAIPFNNIKQESSSHQDTCCCAGCFSPLKSMHRQGWHSNKKSVPPSWFP